MDIIKLCLDMGAAKTEEIPVSDLVFSPELRELCEQNVCGKYGQNYSCPPYVGEVGALIEKINKFEKAIIWQNIYLLEDTLDYDGMMEALEKHNTMTHKIAKKIYSKLAQSEALVLSAGYCTLCEKCAAQESTPCRNPKKALVSLEAYGLNVSKIGEVSNMKYINGKNTVTYFSGAFLTKNYCTASTN